MFTRPARINQSGEEIKERRPPAVRSVWMFWDLRDVGSNRPSVLPSSRPYRRVKPQCRPQDALPNLPLATAAMFVFIECETYDGPDWLFG